MKKILAIIAIVASAFIMSVPSASAHTKSNSLAACNSLGAVNNNLSYSHDGYVAWVASSNTLTYHSYGNCSNPSSWSVWPAANLDMVGTVQRLTYGGWDVCYVYLFSGQYAAGFNVYEGSPGVKQDGICQMRNYPFTTRITTQATGYFSGTSATVTNYLDH